MAHCGKCGQVLATVGDNGPFDSTDTILPSGYQLDERGVWMPTNRHKVKRAWKRQERVPDGAYIYWRGRKGSYNTPDREDVGVEQSVPLPLKMKCPRCPTINLISTDD